MFPSFVRNFDLIGLAETKLDNADVGSLPLPDGYKLITKNRAALSSYSSGGVALLVKDELFPAVCIETGNSKDTLWCSLDKNILCLDKDIVIGVGYISPERSNYSSIDKFDVIEADIFDLVSKKNCEILLMGDFNAHFGSISDITKYDYFVSDQCGVSDGNSCKLFDAPLPVDMPINRRSLETTTHNNYGYRVIDLCKSLGLVILNGRCGQDLKGETTCKGKSVDDIVIISPKVFQIVPDFQVDVFNPLLSDCHNPVCFKLCFAKEALPTDDISTCSGTESLNHASNASTLSRRPVTKWKQDYRNEFCSKLDSEKISHIENLLSEPLLTRESVDNVASCIENLFEDALLKVSPSANRPTCRQDVKHGGGPCNPRPGVKGKKRLSNNEWFDDDCKEKRAIFENAHNTYKKNRSAIDFTRMKECSKEYKRQLAKSKARYKKSFNRKLRNLKSTNPKEYWDLLNGKKSNGSLNIAVDTCMEHFRKLSCAPQDHFEPVDLSCDVQDINRFLNAEFTRDEILAVIKNLKNNKATGFDKITNEQLKDSSDVMLDIYVTLFNAILNTGFIPAVWTMGSILPLYKNKGDKSDPDNYRGITILSCLGKLFTGVINNRLNKMADEAGLIGVEQAGFRSDFSTTDHIFALNCLLDIYLSKGSKIYCAFIDYKKAFDCVWRAGLWQKLLRNNINGKLLKIMVNMYDEAKSCVEVNGVVSNFFTCSVGVRQGENLSPFLFALYLNDLEEFLSSESFKGLRNLHEHSLCDFVRNLGYRMKLLVLLYADDTILLADSPEELQNGLNALYKYCQSWKLSVNTSKTKVLIFSRGKARKQPPEFFYGGSKVELVSDYTYLGVTFNYNGSFTLAKKRLLDQAQKAMYGLIGKCRKLNLPFDVCLELFDRLIVPILTYGCEVWGFENLDVIEKLHVKFMKVLLRCSKFTPSVMLYGDLGRFPLEVTVKAKMISFWNRLIGCKLPKWSNMLYQIVLEMNKKSYIKSPWCNFIKKILDDCGMSNIWLSQNMINAKWLSEAVKLRLKDQFKQQWWVDCRNHAKCSNYQLFSNHALQEYLTTDLSSRHRTALVKFRMCCNKLPDVVRRNSFQALEDDSNLCELCNMRSSGDELHYIIECPFFETHRNRLLRNHLTFPDNPVNLGKKLFCQVMSTSSVEILKNLAEFCHLVMEHFRLKTS